MKNQQSCVTYNSHSRPPNYHRIVQTKEQHGMDQL